MKQVSVLGWATAFLLAAACGSSRRADSFAYVGNNDLSSISVFRVDAATGMLTLLKTVDTAAGGATYCEFHPSGRFMFVSGQFSNVLSTYAIDTSGLPTLVAGSTVATGLNPHNLSLDGAGRFLYVANTSSNTVSGFAVAANGTLTAIPGSPFASGLTPYAVKVVDSGKFAYTANRDSDDISAYSIDSATGALTPIAGQPFGVACAAPRCGPRAIEFSPSGGFAFVPNRFSNNVSVLAVNGTTGAMAPIAGSPFPAGTDPRSLAMDPAGRYLYVPNVTSGDVSAFSIDATTGALKQLAGSPYPAGSGPLSVEVDDSGRFVYVANSASNNVSIYRIDAATGRLTTVGTVATAGSAFSIALK
jgi:6-phosphogluconolactonase (cycloisomerase 2 family)